MSHVELMRLAERAAGRPIPSCIAAEIEKAAQVAERREAV